MKDSIIFHSKRGEKIVANELEISEAKEVLLNSEAKLKWHNNMVEAHFSATAREMKMLVALSAHIDKNGDDFEYCTVSARDLGKLMNLAKLSQRP